MHFDNTISLGNLFTVIFLIFAAAGWWRARTASEKAKEAYQKDMEWRVSNLETWKREHQIDADARDRLLGTMGDILKHVKWQSELMWSERSGSKMPQSPPPAD